MSRRYPLPDLVAELMLMAVTITSVLGFSRVFEDASYRTPLITTAIVVHLSLIVTRRLRGGVALAVLTSLAALAIQVTASLFPNTSRFGLPTAATLDAFDAEIRAGWELFNTVQAPAPASVGFIFAASIAVWATAFLSDWAAFRLKTVGEALIPAAATIVFIALMGVPTGRVRHVFLFMAASIAFLLASRAADRVRSGIWLGGNTNAAYTSLIAAGSVIAAFALIAGLFGGPAFPGADEDPLVDWRQVGAKGPTKRVAISALIDIRARQVDQPDVEAFTVRTDRPGYYRVHALDSFNGNVWTLAADFTDASGELEAGFASNAPTEIIEQEFTLTGLDMEWLPAAYRPIAIEVLGDQKVDFEPNLSTLIAENGSTIPGMQYRVTSARPLVTPEMLSNAPPPQIDARYTELPPTFDPSIKALAQEITAGAPDDYSKALLLQDFFRASGDFEYSLTPPPGHDQDAMLEFLKVRIGYCEQFAGTFAAMARSIGLPTRIAVGFTDGEQDATDPGLWRVSGKHAHSWPEVYFEGVGWLHFEPTPGRGAGETASYTGQQRQQVGDTPAGVGDAAETLPNPTAVPGEVVGPNNAQFPEFELTPEPQPSEGVGTGGTEGGGGFGRASVATLLGMSALAAYAVLVPILKKRRRAKERSDAADDRDRIRIAWSHAISDMRNRGVPQKASETELEYAARAARELRLREIGDLGEFASVAAFSPDAPDSGTADQAEKIEDQIQRLLSERADWTDRALESLDPRPLLTRK